MARGYGIPAKPAFNSIYGMIKTRFFHCFQKGMKFTESAIIQQPQYRQFPFLTGCCPGSPA